MRQALRPDDYAATELRDTLAHGGVLPKRPVAQLLPPLVDILLEERELYRQRRRHSYQATVGTVAFLLIACVSFMLAADPLLAALIDLMIAAYAVWLSLQTDERDRTGAVTHREERSQRERTLTLIAPLTPLHRQALDSLAEMLRGSWRDTATRETLPDLVRLANALERSVFSGGRTTETRPRQPFALALRAFDGSAERTAFEVRAAQITFTSCTGLSIAIVASIAAT